MPIKKEVLPIPAGKHFVITEEKRPKHPHIINHVLTVADKWYEIKVPDDVKVWSLRLRESNDLLYKYDSGSAYKTLSAGGEITQDTAPGLGYGVGAIFVRCAAAGAIVELELWS